jgi:hypothetical protein
VEGVSYILFAGLIIKDVKEKVKFKKVKKALILVKKLAIL